MPGRGWRQEAKLRYPFSEELQVVKLEGSEEGRPSEGKDWSSGNSASKAQTGLRVLV